jgi:ipoprotein LpqH
VKPGFLVAIVGGAIVVTAVAGCGGDNKPQSAPSKTTAVSVPGGGTVSTGQGSIKLTIDGQDQSIQGQVSCITAAGNVTITAGTPTADKPQVVGAVLSDANPPVVQTVTLGSANGVNLGVGAGQGNAEATKDGKTYKITGTGWGTDLANPTAPVTKPFEMTATCP